MDSLPETTKRARLDTSMTNTTLIVPGTSEVSFRHHFHPASRLRHIICLLKLEQNEDSTSGSIVVHNAMGIRLVSLHGIKLEVQ